METTKGDLLMVHYCTCGGSVLLGGLFLGEQVHKM